MTGLVFLPAILLTMTAFTRIIIVLSLLRQALGLTQTPPNQILIGLSLFLTFFVMGPALTRVNSDALQPLLSDKISVVDAIARSEAPLKAFMLKQTRRDDLGLFLRLGGGQTYATPADVPFRLLVPAFVTSELKTGFQIGFLIFLPFIVIDMVVAAVMMSLGMMLLSPTTVSLPIKLMLFVLVNDPGDRLALGRVHPVSAFEITLAARHVLVMTLLFVSPFLGVGLAIGVLVSLFQAGTRMNDMTLHFVPRLLAVTVVIALAGAWIGSRMTSYVRDSAAAMVTTLDRE
jgi:flagellar biosynthetic protein FliP